MELLLKYEFGKSVIPIAKRHTQRLPVISKFMNSPVSEDLQRGGQVINDPNFCRAALIINLPSVR